MHDRPLLKMASPVSSGGNNAGIGVGVERHPKDNNDIDRNDKMMITMTNSNDEEERSTSIISSNDPRGGTYDNMAIEKSYRSSTDYEEEDDDADDVHRSKLNAFFVLLIAAVALGLVQYFSAARAEVTEFEVKFNGYANDLIQHSNQKVNEIAGVARSLSVSTTSLSLFHNDDSTSSSSSAAAAFVSIPAFAQTASQALDLSGASLLVVVPRVTTSTRAEWETFAQRNQHWVQEGLDYQAAQNASSAATTTTTAAMPIPLHVHNATDGEPIFLGSPGPFSPVWEMFPVPTDTSIVNFNLLANETFKSAADFVDRYRKPILSQVVDDASTLFGSGAPPNPTGQPESFLAYPLVEEFVENAPVVGHVLAVVPWDVYFKDKLPLPSRMNEANGGASLHCVVKNNCGQTFTYEITGQDVVYKGPVDAHEKLLSHMETVAPFARFGVEDDETEEVNSSSEDMGEYCKYNLHIYPTDALKEEFESKTGALELGVLFLFVFCAAMVFVLYDCMVARRAEKVEGTLKKTEAIVSSLFPQQVRDRMFIEDKKKQQQQQRSSSVTAGPRGFKKSSAHHIVGGADLKRFLASEHQPEQAYLDDENPFDTKPIADLFPEATVMFADLVGFTAWSSVREPTQVFTLLETVFYGFDRLCKEHCVFKVETVGDCYVAVTGLPVAREDHAEAMCVFARQCLISVNKIVRELEVTLGPDTGDIRMKFGIHSGPIIAGVLRGERARFQLFGDTMNTAARMESTGKPNKIHLSLETADLLVAAGKKDWIEIREGTVVAKGKGELQTYWLLPSDPHEVASSRGGGDDHSGHASSTTEMIMSELSDETRWATRRATSLKTQRLIDWNTELLLDLLKRVVIRRSASWKMPIQTGVFGDGIKSAEKNVGKQKSPRNEVVEVITLPKFDSNVVKEEEPDIELSASVKAQLRDFVSVLASLYRDNPFHCFEHASHVTMSVSKLMTRIVAPGEILAPRKKDKAFILHDHTFGITSDPLTQFSVALAALIHDVDHRGVPNFVLIKEDLRMAKVYSNLSVAEQNSVDLAWNALMDPAFEELRKCIYSTEAELRRFRELVVNSVMATDIFDKELSQFRKNRWAKAFHESSLQEKDSEDDINRKATIVIEHLIQASDVAHTMQHWHIYQKWNERLFQEMYEGFLVGRMPKNPAEGWYESEIGFFDNYIIPLAKKLKECGVFGVSSDEYLSYAEDNRSEWEKKGHEIVQKMVDKYGED